MSNKKLFANSFFYSLGVVFGKATGFLLLPIYTNFLTDHEYGVATTLTSFSAAFAIILSLSLRAAMIRFYNDYEGEDRKKFIGSIISCVILTSIGISFFMILFQKLYAPFIFKGIDFFPIFLGEIIGRGFS
jgi:O-antigen/teichoic acid export membrane protein